MKNFSKKHCKHELDTDLFLHDLCRCSDGKITDKELEALHPCWKRNNQIGYMRGKKYGEYDFLPDKGRSMR